MESEIRQIIKGYILWRSIKLQYHINNQKIVLILAGENEKLDFFALAHLEDFVKWKWAKEAVILAENRETVQLIKKMNYAFPVKAEVMKKEARECLYRFYSFDKFFDQIVFTYTNRPKDNLLGRVLRETEINEEDAVCLALYHLRAVPKLKLPCESGGLCTKKN